MSDDIKNDPEMQQRYREALDDATEELKDSGMCGMELRTSEFTRAREIFKERHGVEWPTPPRKGPWGISN